jgi:Tfp pilus assembly protein PilO
MKQVTARKFFLILLGINILLVGAILVVFTFASSAVQKKSQKIAVLKADIQSNDEVLSNYKVLQNTLKSNKDLEATIQKVLPGDKDQSSALALLDSFSRTDGVPINQITFNPGTVKEPGQTLISPSGIKGVSVIAVNMVLGTTRYENLLNFLKSVEMTQRRMQVTSLNITPNATNPDVLDQTNINIDIYLKSGAS